MGKSDDGRAKIRILRWLGIAIIALLGIPIAATGVVMVLGVTFSLETFRADIEAAATGAFGRTVEIAGPITLLPAFWLLRSRYNPFYDFLEVRTLEWMAGANGGG